MGPRRCLPPLELLRGTRPMKAARSRPDLNALGSVMVAASAVAPMTPMPGMVSSRRLAGHWRCWGMQALVEGVDLRLQGGDLACQQLQARARILWQALIL